MGPEENTKPYYRVLGVSSNASPEELKSAFHRLAKELHPDRHPDDPSATAKFQALNEAYSTLSDPELRAKYDTEGLSDNSTKSQASIDPIKCSVCGAVSAQPRYVIFWHVVSLIFVTWRTPLQGVFCPACATRKALLSSVLTWTLGWWGFPWGPIWTIGALCRNFSGNTQPPDANGQILGHQALYFLSLGQFSLAAASIDQAL